MSYGIKKAPEDMVRRDLINKNFWKNKKILITGHTGFKGVWFTLILKFIGVKKNLWVEPKPK